MNCPFGEVWDNPIDIFFEDKSRAIMKVVKMERHSKHLVNTTSILKLRVEMQIVEPSKKLPGETGQCLPHDSAFPVQDAPEPAANVFCPSNYLSRSERSNLKGLSSSSDWERFMKPHWTIPTASVEPDESKIYYSKDLNRMC